MRAELQDRGHDTDGLDRAALKSALDKELSGVKRPPALLCGSTDTDLNLDSYYVTNLEPLHDIKTMISMLDFDPKIAAQQVNHQGQRLRLKLSISVNAFAK